MKILGIETYSLILPVAEIYGGAAGNLEDCRTLIVRVEGWGEATQGRPGNTYETLETMEVMARAYFAPALVGMNIEETGSVLQKLHQVRYGHSLTKAAIETALYDALGKLYHVPLHRLLGGPYRKEINLVGGLGLDLGPERIGARARQLKQDGFHTFKIKIGGKDRQRDIARAAAVREAVGEEATIRVDGNAAYSFVEAREMLTEFG
jgi:L-Ala-D/L-Glu epimerase / N-acetyl-D-glutamate racemase